MKEKLPAVSIYTDGCYRPASGVGAWACHFACYPNGKFRSCELVHGVADARSSLRMELMAIVRGLGALDQKYRATVFTDCKTLADTINSCIQWQNSASWPAWAANNEDLTLNLFQLMREHAVTVHWIKAHSNSHANRRCDRLAYKSAVSTELRLKLHKAELRLAKDLFGPADPQPCKPTASAKPFQIPPQRSPFLEVWQL